jgi:hypothetical protein
VSGTAIEKPVAEPAVNLHGWATVWSPQQDPPSIYATYWQVRSGFFNLGPKPNAGSIEPDKKLTRREQLRRDPLGG